MAGTALVYFETLPSKGVRAPSTHNAQGPDSVDWSQGLVLGKAISSVGNELRGSKPSSHYGSPSVPLCTRILVNREPGWGWLEPPHELSAKLCGAGKVGQGRWACAAGKCGSQSSGGEAAFSQWVSPAPSWWESGELSRGRKGCGKGFQVGGKEGGERRPAQNHTCPRVATQSPVEEKAQQARWPLMQPAKRSSWLAVGGCPRCLFFLSQK